MRNIHILVVCLGLTLVVYSIVEVARVRQCGSIVRQVQVTSQMYEHLITDLRQYHRDVIMPPSLTRVVSELDRVAPLERGWWTVCGIGGAVVLTGLAGLLMGQSTDARASRLN